MKVHLLVDRGDGLSASTEIPVDATLNPVGPVALRDEFSDAIRERIAHLVTVDEMAGK